MMVDKKTYWILWLKAAGIRAVRTFAQALIAMIGTGLIGLGDVDWGYAFSVAIVATILSLLTSLAGLPEITPPNDDITIEKGE